MKRTETMSTDAGSSHIDWGQLVCIDCILFIANGDLPEDEEDCARITFEFDRYAAEGIEWRVGAETKKEADDSCEEFSVAECDCCGSSLGGARHPAHFLTQMR